MRVALTLTLLIGLAPTFAAQAPQFEVAVIKPSPSDPQTASSAGLRITDRQARFTYLSLKDYIGMAYNVRVYQIVGPDWIASTRFEIAGTIPDGQHATDVPKMMAGLLEDRFHLKSHRENRDSPVYALEALPGFNLTPVPADAPEAGSFTVTSTSGPGGTAVNLGDGASLVIASNRIELRKVTFAQLAGALERFVDRPVIDQSGREGRFTIAIDLMPEDFQAATIRSAVAAGVSLPPAALRLLDTTSPAAIPDALKTLGLSLRRVRAPLEVLVVDSIDRTPTDN